MRLWTDNPERVLVTIDADLKGSLKLRESAEAAGEPVDEAAIAALHERALFGARTALEAGAHPMLADYAAAFTGWDAEQRARFRAGQAAFGASRQAARQGDHETALALGAECLALAERLGDWWGMAMALRGELARQRLVLAKEAGDERTADRMRAVITESLGSEANGLIGAGGR